MQFDFHPLEQFGSFDTGVEGNASKIINHFYGTWQFIILKSLSLYSLYDEGEGQPAYDLVWEWCTPSQ